MHYPHPTLVSDYIIYYLCNLTTTDPTCPDPSWPNQNRPQTTWLDSIWLQPTESTWPETSWPDPNRQQTTQFQLTPTDKNPPHLNYLDLTQNDLNQIWPGLNQLRLHLSNERAVGQWTVGPLTTPPASPLFATRLPPPLPLWGVTHVPMSSPKFVLNCTGAWLSTPCWRLRWIKAALSYLYDR